MCYGEGVCGLVSLIEGGIYDQKEMQPRPRPISSRCAEWVEVLTARIQMSWDGIIKGKFVNH